jgi:hypothetical protein
MMCWISCADFFEEDDVAAQTETVEVKSARKQHQCSWCGEVIDTGQPYMRYRWYGDGAITVKQHPECYAAMNEQIDFEGEVTFSPGDNPRGCNCGHDRDCERPQQTRIINGMATD